MQAATLGLLELIEGQSMTLPVRSSVIWVFDGLVK
jgi:hypothetical protein